jgi:hypothetical protein
MTQTMLNSIAIALGAGILATLKAYAAASTSKSTPAAPPA